jgi:hypothetical protein
MRFPRFNSVAGWTNALLLVFVLGVFGPILITLFTYWIGFPGRLSGSLYRLITSSGCCALLAFALLHGLATLGWLRLSALCFSLFVICYLSLLFDLVRDLRQFRNAGNILLLAYAYTGFITARVILRAQTTPHKWGYVALAAGSALVVVFPSLLIHLFSLSLWSLVAVRVPMYEFPRTALLLNDAVWFGTLTVALLCYFMACERLLPLAVPKDISATRILWRQAVGCYLCLILMELLYVPVMAV